MSRLVAIVLAVFAFGAECEEHRLEDLDNGRSQLTDGTEMRPLVLPWFVTFETDSSALGPMLMQSFDWWNEQVGFDVFTDNSSIGFSEISVEANLMPENVAGEFHDVTREDGMILSGSITISSDIMYDQDYAESALHHEMGHALGLADDPYSIDLNSVMSSPLIEGGQLTDRDRSLLYATHGR